MPGDPDVYRRALHDALEATRTATALITACTGPDADPTVAIGLVNSMTAGELAKVAIATARITAALAGRLAAADDADPASWWAMQASAIVLKADEAEPRR